MTAQANTSAASHWTCHAELHAKFCKKWQNQSLLKAWLRGELEFPLQLPLRRPTGKALLKQYAEVSHWISQWQRDIEQQPVSLLLESVNNRQVHTQQIPRYLQIDTPENLWRWLNCSAEVDQFTSVYQDLSTRWPTLRETLQQSPFRFLEIASEQHALFAVLEWFESHPQSNCYLRQLDIPGVHTKFIERHRALIHDCLVNILPAEQFDHRISSLSGGGFEQKFGLQYDQPTIRFRILDARHTVSGLSDLAVTVSELAHFDHQAFKQVFICENKINGLAFPAVDNALVIFGLGYGVELLARVPWLTNKRLWYWGDIDTHGFSILARLRKHLPQAKSLLMDETTFLACQEFWVDEAKPTRNIDTEHLTDQELALLEGLWNDKWQAKALRLEQEVIPFHHLQVAIEGISTLGVKHAS